MSQRDGEVSIFVVEDICIKNVVYDIKSRYWLKKIYGRKKGHSIGVRKFGQNESLSQNLGLVTQWFSEQ